MRRVAFFHTNTMNLISSPANISSKDSPLRSCAALFFSLITLLLFTSCSSVSTVNVIAVATSGSPEAAARALLRRKKLGYMRNPVQLANDLKGVQRDFERLMDILRGNAGKKWGKKEARLPDRTHYVKYTQGYLSRAV